MAPSSGGLQILLDKLNNLLQDLCLTVNISKSMYIIFKHKRVQINSTLLLSGHELKQVSEVKYLGVILTDDLTISKDVKSALNSFLAQFNSMFHKFSFVDHNIMYYLFKLIHLRFMVLSCGTMVLLVRVAYV